MIKNDFEKIKKELDKHNIEYELKEISREEWEESLKEEVRV